MSANKVYRAIGLMSGTSLDGEIDVALIETDGRDLVKPLDFKPYPYDISVRDKVRACFGKTEKDAATRAAEALVTDIHIAAVKASGFQADIIGFHGQTITHAPMRRFTWQLGDGAHLAQACGMDVIADMRQADIKAGGQGAPLIPLYHAAMMAKQEKPVAVLNLGGVGNITLMDEKGGIFAFDTGPANALMDDYMLAYSGAAYDADGALAASGRVDAGAVNAFLAHEFFQSGGPKSLDRNAWDLSLVAHLSPADAMATLCEMSAQAVGAGLALKGAPRELLVCGGGRKNAHLMRRLQEVLGLPVRPVEALGWNGDSIEAEGFAYLAVRAVLGLPLSLPTTTGAPVPLTGGVLYKAC